MSEVQYAKNKKPAGYRRALNEISVVLKNHPFAHTGTHSPTTRQQQQTGMDKEIMTWIDLEPYL